MVAPFIFSSHQEKNNLYIHNSDLFNRHLITFYQRELQLLRPASGQIEKNDAEATGVEFTFSTAPAKVIATFGSPREAAVEAAAFFETR